MLIQRLPVLRMPAIVATCVALLAMTGCDGKGLEQELSGQLEQDLLDVGLPQKIRRVTAIDPALVRGIATVNGTEYDLDRDPSDNRYKRAVTVPANTGVSIQLMFSETLPDGSLLTLAAHQKNVQVTTANQTVSFLERDYNTGFDRDNDNISNLSERSCGTDPLSFTQTFSNMNVSFTIPAFIADPAITQVIATFDGMVRQAQRRGSSNTFDVSGNPQSGNETSIEIILLQRIDNQSVLIASAEIQSCRDVASLQLADSEFDSDFDDDGDGVSNLQELQSGRNPFVRG